MPLAPKENMLRAIRFEGPEYVPYEDAYSPSPVFVRVSYEGSTTPRGVGGTDRWGVTWIGTDPDMVCFPRDHPLADLSRLDDCALPPPARFRLTEENRNTLQGLDRDEAVVQAVLHYGPFDRSWALVGMENLMIAMLEDPLRVRKLADAVADDHIAAARFFITEVDVDAFLLSDDLGGQRALLMPPQMWRRLFKPALARLVGLIREAGKIVTFHCCGHVMPLVDDLVEIGVNIFNPVQARANDLGELGRRYYGRIAFAGGVDTQHTLMRGSPEEVREEVRLRIRQLAGARGGYIVGPDQRMPFPAENLGALYDEARRAGRYPLQVLHGSSAPP